MKKHTIDIRPCGRAPDSGRARYRVVCYQCRVLVHGGTTAPWLMVEDHMKGKPGYETPYHGKDPLHGLELKPRGLGVTTFMGEE